MNSQMSASDPAHPAAIRFFWLYLLLVTALACGMRLYNLGDYSFWEDELYTVRSATTQGPWRMYLQPKQIGYIPSTLGLWADGVKLDEITWDNIDQWQALGIRPFAARIGPCIVGILTIPLLCLAGRKLLGDRATLIAALLLTVSPWHLFWSQAARFYTLQFLLYNLALIWYLRTCRERSNRLAFLAGLAVFLAYLSQPPALMISLVIAADVVFCLIRRAPINLTAFGWAAGITAVALCTALQLYHMKYAGNDWDAWGELQGHTWKIIAASMILRNEPVLVALAGLSALALLRSNSRLVFYLAAGALLPVLALMALSFKQDLYIHERYAFIVHYAWIALAAIGLAAAWDVVSKEHFGLPLAGATTAAIVVSMLWTDLAYYTHGHGYRRRWQEAYAYIRAQRQPGEDVASFSAIHTPDARFYLETDDVLPYAEFPTSPEQLAALKRPTWLVLPAVSATRGELFPWFNDAADLKRYYDLRILQPFTSIRVYYYRPDAAAVPPAEAHDLAP